MDANPEFGFRRTLAEAEKNSRKSPEAMQIGITPNPVDRVGICLRFLQVFSKVRQTMRYQNEFESFRRLHA